MNIPTFVVGDPVEKVGGDYQFEGSVVSVFKKLSGITRLVVEDDRGVLHVYSEGNLQLKGPLVVRSRATGLYLSDTTGGRTEHPAKALSFASRQDAANELPEFRSHGPHNFYEILVVPNARPAQMTMGLDKGSEMDPDAW